MTQQVNTPYTLTPFLYSPLLPFLLLLPPPLSLSPPIKATTPIKGMKYSHQHYYGMTSTNHCETGNIMSHKRKATNNIKRETYQIII